MIGIAAWGIGLLIIAVGLIVGIKVLISWNNLQFYAKQGLHCYFHPLKGTFDIASRRHPINKSSQRGHIIHLINNIKGKAGMIAANRLTSTRPVVQIFDPVLIREFLLKEDNFYKSNIVASLADGFGFFFQDGEKAFESKAIFAQLFAYDGMDAFTPLICKQIQKFYKRFSDENKLSAVEFKRVELDSLYTPLMKAITSVLLFGRECEDPESLDYKIMESCVSLMNKYLTIIQNPIYIINPWLAVKLRIIREHRELVKEMTEQKKRILQYIKEREKFAVLGESVFDRIIKYNRANPEKKLNEQDIYGTTNLIFFASSDTSQNVTKMGLCTLASREDLRKVIQKASDVIMSHGEPTAREIENNPILTLWLKEALRLQNSISGTFAKIAKQDTTIGDIKIRRGDSIAINFNGLNFDEKFYKNPYTFKLDRFSNEHELAQDRYRHIPFSVGKRICMGRHMAELTVKLFIVYFMHRFEFYKPNDTDYIEGSSIVNHITNPFIMAKLRK